MESITIIILVIVTISALAYTLKDKTNLRKQNQESKTYTSQKSQLNHPIQVRLPYHRKNILTNNEYYFYKRLKPIAEKYNLQILTKIRLADLIEVNQGMTKRDWNIYFSKIKSKHVDFAIADNMKIVLIIELDDKTHQRQERIIRDMFVDDALKVSGYYIVHTYGNTEIIDNALNNYRIMSNH